MRKRVGSHGTDIRQDGGRGGIINDGLWLVKRMQAGEVPAGIAPAVTLFLRWIIRDDTDPSIEGHEEGRFHCGFSES